MYNVSCRTPASPLFIFFNLLLTYFSSKHSIELVTIKNTSDALLMCPTISQFTKG